MCFVLYMASDRARPEIERNEAEPAFYVKRNDPDAESARKQFTKKNVYYLGSDQGCGCGFQQEYDSMNDDSKERESKGENQRRLALYLAECLSDEESIELFGCWSGDEQEDSVQFGRSISPSLSMRSSFLSKWNASW